MSKKHKENFEDRNCIYCGNYIGHVSENVFAFLHKHCRRLDCKELCPECRENEERIEKEINNE